MIPIACPVKRHRASYGMKRSANPDESKGMVFLLGAETIPLLWYDIAVDLLESGCIDSPAWKCVTSAPIFAAVFQP
jgi:hypothetical protein